MSTVLGLYAKQSFSYQFGASYNQNGSIITCPSAGSISKLGAWLRTATGVSGTVVLGLWDVSTGNLLAQSSPFTVSGTTFARYEATISTVSGLTNGQQLYVGVYRSQAWTDLQLNETNSGNIYYKSIVGIGSFSSASAYAYGTMAAYAFFDPNQVPNQPTTESYGVVTSVTPTIRLNVTTPDGQPVTQVQFVITGTSPSHGPYTKTLAGSWASGSWVSYTLAPADLGWTPAAGDSLSYHGTATNGGGTATGVESSVFTINSTAAPTITNPVAGPVIAQPYLANELVGAVVNWTFNDPQGEAQSAYQVKLYADSGGSQGTLLTGADTGKVASVGARTANVIPTAGLSNKTYFWVGVTTWDVHDAVSTEAVVRTRMAWGRVDDRWNVGATPTVWAIESVQTTVPANSQVVIEYTSTTGGTGPTGWTTNFGAVPLRQWLHWRVWLFAWGSGSPTSPSLDELRFSSTSSANVPPDQWDFSLAGGGAGLDVSTWRYGSQSLKIACTGGSTTRIVRQQVMVKPFTTYIISAYIRALVAGGTFAAYMDIFDGANSKLATAQLTATSSDFVQLIPALDSGGRPLTYTTGAETSLWVRCIVVDGAGSSGSAAWFDAVKLEASSVVTPWQPGLVGLAMSVDAGGMVIDASAGGVMRLKGSAGGGTDLVELYQHGLRFGAAHEIYSDGTNIHIAGTTVTTAGMALWDDADAAAQRTTLGVAYGAVGDVGTFALGDAAAAGSEGKVGDAGHKHSITAPAVSFTAVTFSNSWVNYSAGFDTVGYYKDFLGFVHLKGTMKSGTMSATAFTLPSGSRPGASQQYAVVSNSAFGNLTIASDGTVKLISGSNASASLDGIVFYAAG